MWKFQGRVHLGTLYISIRAQTLNTLNYFWNMFDYFCKKYSQLSTLSTKRVTPLNIEVSVIPFYLFVKRDAVRPFFAVSIAIFALYAPSSPSFQILFVIEYVHIVSKIVWFWYDDSMMVWKWYDCMTSVWWFANSSKVRIGTNSNQIAAEDHPCTIFRFSTRLDVQN